MFIPTDGLHGVTDPQSAVWSTSVDTLLENTIIQLFLWIVKAFSLELFLIAFTQLLGFIHSLCPHFRTAEEPLRVLDSAL